MNHDLQNIMTDSNSFGKVIYVHLSVIMSEGALHYAYVSTFASKFNNVSGDVETNAMHD